MMTLAEELETLRAENETLKSMLALRAEFTPPEEPHAKFSPSERRVLAALFQHEGSIVSYSTLWNALYGLHHPEAIPATDIIKVWVSRIKSKLINHRVHTHWGLGYRLEKADRNLAKYMGPA